jgi:hypothetical protein
MHCGTGPLRQGGFDGSDRDQPDFPNCAATGGASSGTAADYLTIDAVTGGQGQVERREERKAGASEFDRWRECGGEEAKVRGVETRPG